MLTYTGRRNLFGDLCNNSASATLTLADTLMNLQDRRIISAKDWPFLWRQYTKNTVADESSIKLPAYTYKPQGVYVTVGSYRYTPTEVTNREDWDKLNATTFSSDIATHYFVYDEAIELFPTPSTSNNVVTFNARRRTKDLTISDYTTGTITDIATSGVTTTITGSGVTWGTGMIGQYIRVNQTNAALGGDGFWYEIASVPTSTTLTLVRTYGGTAITGASATYTIGEGSLIPEPHDILPVYAALNVYFTSTDPNKTKADLYGNLFNDGYDQMVRDHGSKVNVVLDDGTGQYENIVNPNLYIET